MEIIKKNFTEILIISGVLVLILYSSDPTIFNDSGRYIGGSLLDPPLYSKIISIMLSIFQSLNSVIVLQITIIGFSIIFFTRTVAIKFELSPFVKTLIGIFLFIPTIKFYNYLLTEPLSYAFSILLVTSVLKSIYKPSKINLFWVTIFTILLLLMRNQFIFIYPIILLLYFGIYLLNKSKKFLFLLVISYLSIVFIHNSMILLNTYIKQSSLNSENLTYVALGPYYFTYFDAIYISDSKEIELFENENIKKTLSQIYEEMNNSKALSKHYNGRGHFGLSVPILKEISKNLLITLAKEESTNVTSLKKEISLKIIHANFGKYIKHIFKKFYDTTWLFIFVSFFILITSLMNFYKYKSKISLFFIFISLFAVANHMVVYLFGRVQPRYLIYSDLILLIFIFIVFYIFQQDKQSN